MIKGKPMMIDERDFYRPTVEFPKDTELYGHIVIALSEDKDGNHTVTASRRFADQPADRHREIMWNRLDQFVTAALVLTSGTEGHDFNGATA